MQQDGSQEMCFSLTLRKMVRNGIPMAISTAIPATVEAILSRDSDPDNDSFYSILPLWATAISIAALTLIIRALVNYPLNKIYPSDPEAKYLLDAKLVKINLPENLPTFFKARKSNSEAGLEHVPLINDTERPRPCLRYAIRSLIPNLIGIGSAIGVEEITTHSSGAQDQLYSNVPVWVTTLAIAVLALAIRSGMDSAFEYFWPYDPEKSYRQCRSDNKAIKKPSI